MTTVDHVFIPDAHVGLGKEFEVSALFGEAPRSAFLGQPDIDKMPAPVVWTRGRRATIHRDNLRGGWFVAKEGTRYIAVRGVKAGQCVAVWGTGATDEEDAKGDTASLNEGRVAHDDLCWSQPGDDPRCWAILDLHDLADRRAPSKAPEPRYVVKRAEEMKPGEPYVDAGGANAFGGAAAIERCVQLRRELGPSEWVFDHGPLPMYLVDTQDAWHTLARNTTIVMGDTWAANESPRFARLRKAPPPSPAPVKAEPVGPTDAEIVASGAPTHRWEPADNLRRVVCLRCARHVPMDKATAGGAAAVSGLVGDCWDGFRAWAQRRDEDVVRSMQYAQQDEVAPGLGWVKPHDWPGKAEGAEPPKGLWTLQVASGGICHDVSRIDASAAWSRVLASRLAASDRARRYEVVCEGDHPADLVGCDVKAGL
jgi:hypothetical protein